MHILRELLFNPGSRFTDMNISGLSSDHFTYHVSTLVKAGYVSKSNSKYQLTKKGKEYADRMDTESAKRGLQPILRSGICCMSTKEWHNEWMRENEYVIEKF